MSSRALERAGAWFARASDRGAEKVPEGLVRTVQGSNHFFLLSSVTNTPIAIMIAVAAWPQTLGPAIAHVAMIAALLVAVFFNGRGLHVAATLVGVGLPIIQFVYLAALFSERARFELHLLLLGGLVYVVFLPSRWRWGLLASAFGVAAAALLVALPAFDAPRVDVPDWWLSAIGIYNMGAAALFVFLVGYFNYGYLQRERGKSALLLEEARQIAVTDALTGLYNRRGIEPELQAVQREGDFSLAIVDVDHFKQVNDHLGHQAGDDVLADIARMLRDSLPRTVAISRWGGEEFLVLMPQTGLQDSLSLLEAARLAIDHEVTGESGSERVTISAGVVRVERPAPIDIVLARADAQLYEAKRDGRNNVRGVVLRERARPRGTDADA
ncbi:GGDEF domain-containing protein [Demequina zhanjiangensis]|uniref:GGDEF domain-containing protein n=1 Tax=Demequina zhanjiangensis TaxID=3051659 RepID=A0ABT8FXE2_9MICO|nr:GGDEF domain-containing protein [Demequina sp. SYSU T00b26]MDN4471580.1 GGDEF domain-containing protein [Demequina sp. SYSU T00b26]